ncbi:MAG TPA: sporulation protein [Candidatus Limnocylindria bacterium]|jgi:uncharacterized spore protein YtfJ
MTSVIQETMQRTVDGMHPKQVFGEPIERDGVVYLPAAKVRGGGGGGGDKEGNGGGGFGLTAKPAGMYVIRNGDAEWRPALDINRIVLGAQVVAIVALLVLRSIVKARR